VFAKVSYHLPLAQNMKKIEILKRKIEKVPKNLGKHWYMSLTTCHLLIDMIPKKFMGDTLQRLVAKM
jgi:archaellum biogenesis protein FlaJ (TadC family)